MFIVVYFLFLILIFLYYNVLQIFLKVIIWFLMVEFLNEIVIYSKVDGLLQKVKYFVVFFIKI